jgi:lactoylglutathione lyase
MPAASRRDWFRIRWMSGKRCGVNALVENASIGAITLFAEDLERSKLFYADVFGLPVAFEDENSAVFRFENTIINLLRISAAYELIAPGTVASREAGSRFAFTIGVDDVDEVCAELARRGVELLNGPMNRPWGIRTASFTDPGGHIWEIAQDLA